MDFSNIQPPFPLTFMVVIFTAYFPSCNVRSIVMLLCRQAAVEATRISEKVNSTDSSVRHRSSPLRHRRQTSDADQRLSHKFGLEV